MLEKDDRQESLISSQRSGEIISTTDPFSTIESKESIDEQIDQDKVQVELQEFKAEYTSVMNVLTSDLDKLREKDKFDLVKFTIKVKAVYKYEWEVYRKPTEIKKNFAEIHSELSKNYMEPSGNKADIFTNVASWTDDSIQMHIANIESYYKTFFNDPKIYNTLPFKEFFNINYIISFSINNQIFIKKIYIFPGIRITFIHIINTIIFYNNPSSIVLTKSKIFNAFASNAKSSS